MNTLKKYWTIQLIYLKTNIARDIGFRFSFFLCLIGSFCYVILNFFLIYFLVQKVSIGFWTEKELMVLLGNFLILTYAIFFLFWRGFLNMIRNIRNGTFDFTLIRPADSQFLATATGGAIHNLLVLFFGFGVVIYSLIQLQQPITFIQILLWILTLSLSILACYSYILLLIMLNFRYGYLEEIINLSFSFQDFSRYPVDAFSRLPIYLFVFALPFSILTTIPSIILTKSILPWWTILIFVIVSILFILFVRKMWFRALRNYTSSN